MKYWAAILLLNITFFLVQPLFAPDYEDKTPKTCCPESNKDKKECPKNCNPLFTCMYCQYLPAGKIKIKEPSCLIFIEHFKDFNAGILQGYIPDCWHPPSDLCKTGNHF